MEQGRYEAIVVAHYYHAMTNEHCNIMISTNRNGTRLVLIATIVTNRWTQQLLVIMKDRFIVKVMNND